MNKKEDILDKLSRDVDTIHYLAGVMRGCIKDNFITYLLMVREHIIQIIELEDNA